MVILSKIALYGNIFMIWQDLAYLKKAFSYLFFLFKMNEKSTTVFLFK